MTLEFAHNSADISQIQQHLMRCDHLYLPPLSARLDLGTYATKMATHADIFECWSNRQLVAMVAIYANDPLREIAHITNVSVEHMLQGQGIGQTLMRQAIEHTTRLGFKKINLHVNSKNSQAMKLYHNFGFAITLSLENDIVELTLTLPTHETRL